MSHLVAPQSFRIGKTQAWHHNTLRRNKSLTTNAGLEKITRLLLRRKRFYIINATQSGMYHNRIDNRIIFLPRIKIRPRQRNIGIFIRGVLYNPIGSESVAVATKRRYANLRRRKVAKIRKRRKPKQLNKWLTRRMFKGTDRTTLFKRQIRHLTSPALKNIRYFEKLATRLQKKYAYKKNGYKKIHWKSRWASDKIKTRRFNSRKFSHIVANAVNIPLRIDCVNLFSYLMRKKLVDFKTHQNHFWHFRYRRFRFQYKNYYDILNSFLSIGLVDNTESFFLSILKMTLPLIRKFKKFFKFLSIVIRYLPELEKKFAIFRIFITGKLAGGTKRTKFHRIGYGTLPVQSLTVNAINNFLPYTHVYGAFGLKLLMSKHNVQNFNNQLIF